MVLLYTPPKQATKQPKNRPHFVASKQATNSLTVQITDLDYQGLGVAKIDGKTWFVENALPSEVVQIRVLEEKRQYGQGVTQNILQPSPVRQTPKCGYYGTCGGCQSQHIPLELQRAAKQNALFRSLSKLQPEAIEFMPMITGEQWQYRRRIRFGLRVNPQTRKLDIGFRQKASNQIVNIAHCEVIESALNKMLPKLTALLHQFSQPKLLGHLELVAADNGVAVLLRLLLEKIENLPKTDRTLLLDFAETENVGLFLQDNSKITQIRGELPYYQIDDLRLQFDIADFIQVNAALNRQMVATALDWLDLQPQDRVLDLFCGMGNFTLPLSRRVKSAVGIEGVLAMVEKAQANAERNGCKNVQFYRADLAQAFVNQPWATLPFDKILLDPPRSGAAFALNALCALRAEKILYVSCNPATLVRDAEILYESGYRVRKAAMVDMFPNTGHLENITLFERK